MSACSPTAARWRPDPRKVYNWPADPRALPPRRAVEAIVHGLFGNPQTVLAVMFKW